MKLWHPNVVGNRYENHFQNSGNAVVGHEKPVRNRQIGDTTRNRRNTDSLLVISALHVIENITQSVTKNSSNSMISQKLPLCGNPNMDGTIVAIYMAIPMYISQ